MRDAVSDAYTRITGHAPAFIFSAWNADLTEEERAVHEHRIPTDCPQTRWSDEYVADLQQRFTQQAQEVAEREHKLVGLCHAHGTTLIEIHDLKQQLATSQARCREMESRRFPIMRGPSVPWEVMSPHESMAQKNHSQTLHKLAERGGLAPCEAWCVVSGIQYGIASKEQWQLWDAEWFKYAEQVNLHYSKLAQLQATLADAQSRIADLETDVRSWKEDWQLEVIEHHKTKATLAVSQARCREMERALHVTSWLGAHATEIVRVLKAACSGPECCCGDDTDIRCGVCQSRILLSTLEAACRQ